MLRDMRRKASCTHELLLLLRQRIYALALGYEGLNDHHELHHDMAVQTAAAHMVPLASPSPLYRWKQRADRNAAPAQM